MISHPFDVGVCGFDSVWVFVTTEDGFVAELEGFGENGARSTEWIEDGFVFWDASDVDHHAGEFWRQHALVSVASWTAVVTVGEVLERLDGVCDCDVGGETFAED